jgi:uroporphyrinogen decarboxylase
VWVTGQAGSVVLNRLICRAQRSGLNTTNTDPGKLTMPMTSRERVLSILNHEQADRVPLVLGVSNATGIKMQPYRGIKRLAGIDAPDNYIYEWPELGTAQIDEETMQRLHSDVRGVLDLEPESVRQRNRERDPHSDFIDSWGSGQCEGTPGQWFPGVHPMPGAKSIEDLDNYEGWPDMSDPTRIAHVRADSCSTWPSTGILHARSWKGSQFIASS